MIPLGAMLLLAIYIFVERSIAVRHASKIDENFMSIVRDNIVNGNIKAARSFAKNNTTPVARIVDKGIQRIGKPNIGAALTTTESISRFFSDLYISNCPT